MMLGDEWVPHEEHRITSAAPTEPETPPAPGPSDVDREVKTVLKKNLSEIVSKYPPLSPLPFDSNGGVSGDPRAPLPVPPLNHVAGLWPVFVWPKQFDLSIFAIFVAVLFLNRLQGRSAWISGRFADFL